VSRDCEGGGGVILPSPWEKRFRRAERAGTGSGILTSEKKRSYKCHIVGKGVSLYMEGGNSVGEKEKS